MVTKLVLLKAQRGCIGDSAVHFSIVAFPYKKERATTLIDRQCLVLTAHKPMSPEDQKHLIYSIYNVYRESNIIF